MKKIPMDNEMGNVMADLKGCHYINSGFTVGGERTCRDESYEE
jgi:hypothetical protein